MLSAKKIFSHAPLGTRVQVLTATQQADLEINEWHYFDRPSVPLILASCTPTLVKWNIQEMLVGWQEVH
jgi:hypothetical protein